MGSVSNSPTPYSTARTDLCGGPSVMSVPTAISRTYPVGSYWVPGWWWVRHATRPAMRAPSRALPRRRALCTNWKKPVCHEHILMKG